MLFLIGYGVSRSRSNQFQRILCPLLIWSSFLLASVELEFILKVPFLQAIKQLSGNETFEFQPSKRLKISQHSKTLLEIYSYQQASIFLRRSNGCLFRDCPSFLICKLLNSVQISGPQANQTLMPRVGKFLKRIILLLYSI